MITNLPHIKIQSSDGVKGSSFSTAAAAPPLAVAPAGACVQRKAEMAADRRVHSVDAGRRMILTTPVSQWARSLRVGSPGTPSTTESPGRMIGRQLDLGTPAALPNTHPAIDFADNASLVTPGNVAAMGEELAFLRRENRALKVCWGVCGCAGRSLPVLLTPPMTVLPERTECYFHHHCCSQGCITGSCIADCSCK